MPMRAYCYCANYYGAANCHNIVSRFGDRCKLCKAMNEGRSFRYDFAGSSSLAEEEVYDSEAVADDDDSSQGSSDDQRRDGNAEVDAGFTHPRSRRMTH